jgi:hypothetical protein|tara:strand:- start:236 stop:784 length:549 start_codon:yes stop_codon:yes gene_type:complete
MTINLRADAPSQVTQADPTKLAEEIKTLQDIQQEIDNHENKIKELKEREKYFSGIVIPDLMNQMNLKTMKLRDGSEIEVKNVFFASIPADQKEQAYNWLRDNGLGNIVKNEITVRFGRNEDNKAQQYAALAKGQGYDPEQKVSVHASTLRLTLEDLHTRGGKIPSELFRTFEGYQTKIKTKK